MNRAQKILKIGRIGEELVKEVLSESGDMVTLSESKFDTVKDMIINDKLVVLRW